MAAVLFLRALSESTDGQEYPAGADFARIRPTVSLKTTVNLVCRLHLNGLNPNRQHSETSLRLAVKLC
ncbi:hypothetical protein AOLI_G00317350 [Acnodon oligacanthus]